MGRGSHLDRPRLPSRPFIEAPDWEARGRAALVAKWKWAEFDIEGIPARFVLVRETEDGSVLDVSYQSSPAAVAELLIDSYRTPWRLLGVIDLLYPPEDPSGHWPRVDFACAPLARRPRRRMSASALAQAWTQFVDEGGGLKDAVLPAPGRRARFVLMFERRFKRRCLEAFDTCKQLTRATEALLGEEARFVGCYDLGDPLPELFYPRYLPLALRARLSVTVDGVTSTVTAEDA